jgi:hypothetical protein
MNKELIDQVKSSKIETRSSLTTVLYELKDTKNEFRPPLVPGIQGHSESSQSDVSTSSPSASSSSQPSYSSPLDAGAASTEIVTGLQSLNLSDIIDDNEMAAASDTALPPPFTGHFSQSATDWFRDFRRYADYKDLNAARRLQLFKYLIRDTAADWLDNLPAAAVADMASITAAFDERFKVPDIVQFKSTRDLFNRRQGEVENVDDYVLAMTKLARSVGADAAVIRFAVINGLRPQIAAYVLRQQPATVEEVAAAARVAEATAERSSALAVELGEMRAEMRRMATKNRRWTVS